MEWLARIFRRWEPAGRTRPEPIFLTNTLSGAEEVFTPLTKGVALLYSCGPTVYDRAHIGNLRAYVFADTLARTLAGAGYRVRRVINITDVGHLTSDADEGEDKMSVAARREHAAPDEIADRYAKRFIEDLDDLGIDTDDILFPRATEYIREQISLAKTLEEKGYAYRTADGLYFDTSRFRGYGKLGNVAGASLVAGARVAVGGEKRHPADFALWRAAKPGDLQQWLSPWGPGNPGWHIECSAMSRALLGPEIDIHTGGEDHIQIHHNNEIAQSEAASGRPFVRYWMHNAFLTMSGEKASKSLGNVIYLSDISGKGYHPLSLRYFFLQAHYRTPLSFTWDALAGAASALERLWRTAREIATESGRKAAHSSARDAFLAAMRDDLSTPQALGILWDALKSDERSAAEKWGLLKDADLHLGLSLFAPPPERTPVEIPPEVAEILVKREAARRAKDYAEADRLRGEIATRGYRVEDGPDGPVLSKTAL
ncbi:MAG TPA: cysteine--tRNA ligase [Candidatus Paceibacterota bacterium]|nr:cysteine--tRNA ligase [Candidatus Paceibacterota bacterium]